MLVPGKWPKRRAKPASGEPRKANFTQHTIDNTVTAHIYYFLPAYTARSNARFVALYIFFYPLRAVYLLKAFYPLKAVYPLRAEQTIQ